MPNDGGAPGLSASEDRMPRDGGTAQIVECDFNNAAFLGARRYDAWKPCDVSTSTFSGRFSRQPL
jgi:hypothetical protein